MKIMQVLYIKQLLFLFEKNKMLCNLMKFKERKILRKGGQKIKEETVRNVLNKGGNGTKGAK